MPVYCLHLRDQIRGRRGNDAVDHGAGKRTSRAIQSAKPGSRRSAIASTALAQHPAIAGQVVQRQQSEKARSPIPRRRASACTMKPGAVRRGAARGRLSEATPSRLRSPDIRMIEVERLITGAAAVSLFRDRQGDETNGRVSHGRQHREGIFRGDQHVADDLDLLRRFHAAGAIATVV